ncbi:MAG: glycosyltransferase [Phascolarctobacterium sp.]|uniref:glycosyltransferase family 2 protein n=1 Tax=Phascolarctobacterium sp. TaxID=2049039 RepID=UPI0026DB9DEA|nr:glycosyltransferase family 2 protein [Phascolarctobacterium sp.]MDO4922071.1 glycosyltransferase [Phascolarctobacterium sp.]
MKKTDSPLISVIIPCFNLEKVIGKCIDSIVNQTYKNLQIIVVNDGSLDNSKSIIDTYAKSDSRIMPIHQGNGGVGCAYNQGLKAAIGEYIYILDGDNYVDLDFLETLLCRSIEDKCDVVVCDYCLENYCDGQYVHFGSLEYPALKMYGKEEIATCLFDMYKKYIWQSPCNKLYKSCLLKNLYFEENRNYMMIVDSDFNIRLLNRINSVVTINQPLVHYVQYDLDFRKQITSMWKYRYESRALECEERLFHYLINYFEAVGDDKKIDRLEEITNYFVGRFLKIAQVLFLDKRIIGKVRKQELRYLNNKIQLLFDNKKITYIPYRILYNMIKNKRWMLLRVIYVVLSYCQGYLPRLFKMMKAG